MRSRAAATDANGRAIPKRISLSLSQVIDTLKQKPLQEKFGKHKPKSTALPNDSTVAS